MDVTTGESKGLIAELITLQRSGQDLITYFSDTADFQIQTPNTWPLELRMEFTVSLLTQAQYDQLDGDLDELERELAQ